MPFLPQSGQLVLPGEAAPGSARVLPSANTPGLTPTLAASSAKAGGGAVAGAVSTLRGAAMATAAVAAFTRSKGDLHAVATGARPNAGKMGSDSYSECAQLQAGVALGCK